MDHISKSQHALFLSCLHHAMYCHQYTLSQIYTVFRFLTVKEIIAAKIHSAHPPKKSLLSATTNVHMTLIFKLYCLMQ